MSDRPPPDADDPWPTALDWLFRLDRTPDDAALLGALATWRNAHPANDRAYREAAALWSAGREISPSTRARWPEPAAVRQPASLPRRKRRRLRVAAAVAASLLIAGSYGWWRDAFVDHATGVGGAARIALSDRSEIRLDTNSALDVSYGPDRRTVDLARGRAFFAVRRDPKRPFVVRADSVTVRVVGTAFDVRRTGGAVTVRVTEGTVLVGTVGAGARAALGPLTSGDRVVVDLATGAVRRDRLPVGTIEAWRRGRLIVDRWTVRQVLDEIARYHRGFILVRDDTLAERRISGSYDLTRPVDAVRAVAAAFGARVRAVTDYLLIVDTQ